MSAIIQFFSVVIAFFLSLFNISSGMCVDAINNYGFTVDATSIVSEELSNPVSNVNVWSISENGPFVNVKPNTENNVFDFVEYVQLMQCTGGSYERDLFKDPYDTSVLNDYDFTSLIANCKGILELGAKPVLKLGSVPMKYSADAIAGEFATNIYPPDDYNVYYNYIKAITQALVEEFGLEEVRAWRFGVMTEYENSSWFMAKSGKAQDSAVEYCKLYDYTVQALIDVLGDDIFVGAHSMSVTEGLWDEAIFINHCASGTNYATGKIGSEISYLAASFYDSKPGEFTSGKTLAETIDYLRSTAEKAGLKDLIYGVDEGRILTGNSSGKTGDELLSRTCGYIYQAAYDARMYKTMFENDINYFSSWYYLSNGLLEGNPTVSYYVAKLVSAFAGSKLVTTTMNQNGYIYNAEVDAVSAYNEESKTLRIMAYNFKNDVNYATNANVSITVNADMFNGKEVSVTTYVIDDNCNYFDEWLLDRQIYNIDDDCFSWSPDDPLLDNPTTLSDFAAREIYKTLLYDKYTECSKLIPDKSTLVVEDGLISLNLLLAANTVVFYEISVA